MSLLGRRSGGRHDGPAARLLVAIATALILAGAAPASAPAYRLVAWGSNQSGQLGNGSSGEDVDGAVLVRGRATSVAAGANHSLALRPSGRVAAWGGNEAGQLGDGTTESSDVPQAVSGLTGVTAIAAGSGFSLALLGDGTVMAWGNNRAGELGDGTTESSDLPVRVSGLSGVTAIAAGADFSLALLSDGRVMAWGDNGAGQLGDGNFSASEVPVEVRSLHGATAISAGARFALALLGDGTVMAWGDNRAGELGDGTTESSDVPVESSGLSGLGVTAISAGADFSLALLGDGMVAAWGDNEHGQLGDGGTEGTGLPVVVSGLSGVTAISAGADFSLALLGDGTVRAWGNNEHGQLGTENTTSHDVPVAVEGISAIAGISAGHFHSLAYGSLTPTVTSVSPASGPTSGATSVTIRGSNLGGATAVEFGPTKAASFTVNSMGSITAFTPPGTGAVDVLVRTPAGTSGSGPGDRYTYEGEAVPTEEEGVPTEEEEAVPTTLYRGVNSHAPWFWQVSDLEVKLEIAEAAALGVNHIRVPVEWGAIETAKESRPSSKTLARLDLIVNEAAAHGIGVDGTIDPTPDWASTGHAWYDAPSDPEYVRPFAKWLAQRYGSKLIAVGALNEPNVPGNYRKPNGEYFSSMAELAAYYTKEANAIYLGAKEGNPTIKVLFGESGNAGGYLAYCLADGIKFTGLGLHAYSEGAAPEQPNYSESTKSKVEAAHELLEEYGRSSAPIWVNEWGYSIENSETVRADYTRKGVELLDSFPYVEGWAYYQLRDTYTGSGAEENFGLLRYGFLPRLSLAAFKAGMA